MHSTQRSFVLGNNSKLRGVFVPRQLSQGLRRYITVNGKPRPKGGPVLEDDGEELYQDDVMYQATGVAGLPLLFGEHQASHHPKGLLTQTLEEKQAFWRKLYWEPDPHNERQWMMPGSENIFEETGYVPVFPALKTQTTTVEEDPYLYLPDMLPRVRRPRPPMRQMNNGSSARMDRSNSSSSSSQNSGIYDPEMIWGEESYVGRWGPIRIVPYDQEQFVPSVNSRRRQAFGSSRGQAGDTTATKTSTSTAPQPQLTEEELAYNTRYFMDGGTDPSLRSDSSSPARRWKDPESTNVSYSANSGDSEDTGSGSKRGRGGSKRIGTSNVRKHPPRAPKPSDENDTPEELAGLSHGTVYYLALPRHTRPRMPARAMRGEGWELSEADMGIANGVVVSDPAVPGSGLMSYLYEARRKDETRWRGSGGWRAGGSSSGETDGSSSTTAGGSSQQWQAPSDTREDVIGSNAISCGIVRARGRVSPVSLVPGSPNTAGAVRQAAVRDANRETRSSTKPSATPSPGSSSVSAPEDGNTSPSQHASAIHHSTDSGEGGKRWSSQDDKVVPGNSFSKVGDVDRIGSLRSVGVRVHRSSSHKGIRPNVTSEACATGAEDRSGREAASCLVRRLSRHIFAIRVSDHDTIALPASKVPHQSATAQHASSASALDAPQHQPARKPLYTSSTSQPFQQQPLLQHQQQQPLRQHQPPPSQQQEQQQQPLQQQQRQKPRQKYLLQQRHHRLQQGEEATSAASRAWAESVIKGWNANPQAPAARRLDLGFENPTQLETAVTQVTQVSTANDAPTPPMPQPHTNIAAQNSSFLSLEDPNDPWAVRASTPRPKSPRPVLSDSGPSDTFTASASTQPDRQSQGHILIAKPALNERPPSESSPISEAKSAATSAASSRYLSVDARKQVALRLRSSQSGHNFRPTDTGSSRALYVKGGSQLFRVFKYAVDDLRLYKALAEAGMEGRVVVVEKIDMADVVLASCRKLSGKDVPLAQIRAAAFNAKVPFFQLQAISAKRIMIAIAPLMGIPIPAFLLNKATVRRVLPEANSDGSAAILNLLSTVHPIHDRVPSTLRSISDSSPSQTESGEARARDVFGDVVLQSAALLQDRAFVDVKVVNNMMLTSSGGMGSRVQPAALLPDLDVDLGFDSDSSLDRRKACLLPPNPSDQQGLRYPVIRPIQHGGKQRQRRMLKEVADQRTKSW